MLYKMSTKQDSCLKALLCRFKSAPTSFKGKEKTNVKLCSDDFWDLSCKSVSPASPSPTCVTELLMSCVCIYAPHLTSRDGPSSLPSPRAVLSEGIWGLAKTSACYNKRENSFECSFSLKWRVRTVSLRSPCIQSVKRWHQGPLFNCGHWAPHCGTQPLLPVLSVRTRAVSSVMTDVLLSAVRSYFQLFFPNYFRLFIEWFIS